MIVLVVIVGIGNIVGVVIVIGIGGFGVFFWMWVIGLFGMVFKYFEVFFGVCFCKIDDVGEKFGGF